MANCPNCSNGDANVSLSALQADDICPTVVHENVCVQGTVTITPKVDSEGSTSVCLGNPIIGNCPGTLQDFCSFTVSQNICVQIPLDFSATATAEPDGLVCGLRDIGECQNGNACTHTIGFFRNNSDVTEELIDAAGGTITLGTGAGLSFVVDVTNVNDVLDFNTDSPPAPDSPPFAGQYQVLYAQLLAAKLNVINLTALGVEICSFAVTAIMNADNFLGSSPLGGMPGAPTFQEPLAEFNEGDAPGCPFHCND